jgi:hypothetical protein
MSVCPETSGVEDKKKTLRTPEASGQCDKSQ